MWYNEKKGNKVQEKGTIMIFPPTFCISRAFGMLQFPKQYVVFKVLTENTEMYFSKRVLRVDTARNKWLGKALHTNEIRNMKHVNLYQKMSKKGFFEHNQSCSED